jgi:ribonucleoside-diphosphate reductase alpha chain
MPPERASYTKVFRLPYQHKDGSTDIMKFYFTVGLYDDGRVGEVFIKADKVGTLASGALDAVAIYLSMLLQAGTPLEEVLAKIKGTRFPPAGFTGEADVKNCTSPLDLLARWLEHKFLPKEGS